MVTDKPQSGVRVCGSGCKCSFCPDCARGAGWKVRQKLLLAMTRWEATRPVMITLTLDPANFLDACSAMTWVKKKRLVGKLLQTLRRALGFRYHFQVVEWTKNGWPHWHILIDCEFVPYKLLDEAWQKLGPATEGATRRMGHVWISKGGKLQSKEHGAFYATKYLIKPPKHGYPEWVLATEGLFFKRWQGSVGLFRDEELEEMQSAAEIEAHWKQMGYPPEWDEREEEEPKKKQEYKRATRTIRQRVESCGTKVVVMSYYEAITAGGEIVTRRTFRFGLPIAFSDVCRFLNRGEEGHKLELSRAEYETLREIHDGEKSRDHFNRWFEEQAPKRQGVLFEDISGPVLQGVGI